MKREKITEDRRDERAKKRRKNKRHESGRNWREKI
jgi:hypothetical protein